MKAATDHVVENKPVRKSDGGEENEQKHGNKQSTLITKGTTNSIVGPIDGWVPCKENLPDYPTCVYFGKRRTGKSTSIMNLAFHTMLDIPFGIVMSNTSYAGYWEQFVPKAFIVQGMREDILLWVMNRQKRLIKKYGIEDPRCGCFIILDDVIADQSKMRYSTSLNSFFVEGRHLAISVHLASQYIKGVGPMVRGNCDYIFLQPIYNMLQRETLWQMEGAFTDKKTWSMLMDQIITRKNLPGNCARTPKKEVQIMVVACFEDCPNAREKIFSWKPVHTDGLPAFRLCHPIYWDKNEEMESAFREVPVKPDELVLRDVVTELSSLGV